MIHVSGFTPDWLVREKTVRRQLPKCAQCGMRMRETRGKYCGDACRSRVRFERALMGDVNK